LQKILLIVDSPGDLTPEEIAGRDIWVAPVRVIYNNREHCENDIDIPKFWKILENLDEIPTTATILPHEWRDLFEKAAARGYTHVDVLTISSTASSIWSNALIGVKQYQEEDPNAIPVYIQDSRSYAFIYGRNALATVDQIERGMEFEQACGYIRDLCARSHGLLWVYTLKHLRRSGRISGMAAFVGEALGLRPVLYAKDGVIEPVDRVRGNKALLPRVADWAKRHAVNPQDQVLSLLYADVPQEEIDLAISVIREALNPKDIVPHRIGCAIAINCGPVSMALAYYGEAFDL